MNVGVFNNTNDDINGYLDNLKIFLDNACDYLKLGEGEFNVIIVDNNKIWELNRGYRGIDRPTDVISFALEDDKTFNSKDYRILGDIYISIDKVREQSENYGHSFERELFFLAIHGLLHLLGYDHMTKEDEEVMFKKQEEVLSYYGINR